MHAGSADSFQGIINKGFCDIRTGGLSVASLKIQAHLRHWEATGWCLAAW